MLGSVQEEIEVIFESKHSLWAQIRWLSIMRSLVLPPPNTAVTGLSFCRELLPGSDSARVKSACNAGLDSPQGSSSSLASLLYCLVLLSFFLFIQSKNPNQPDYHRVQGTLTLVHLLQRAPCGPSWASTDAFLMTEAFEKELSYLDSLLSTTMLTHIAAIPSDRAFSRNP